MSGKRRNRWILSSQSLPLPSPKLAWLCCVWYMRWAGRGSTCLWRCRRMFGERSSFLHIGYRLQSIIFLCKVPFEEEAYLAKQKEAKVGEYAGLKKRLYWFLAGHHSCNWLSGQQLLGQDPQPKPWQEVEWDSLLWQGRTARSQNPLQLFANCFTDRWVKTCTAWRPRL